MAGRGCSGRQQRPTRRARAGPGRRGAGRGRLRRDLGGRGRRAGAGNGDASGCADAAAPAGRRGRLGGGSGLAERATVTTCRP